MKDIIQPYDDNNHKEFMEQAHGLKGASGYIGAGRLHYVCYYIQQLFINEQYQKELTFYPNLVEAAIEFKVYSRTILAKYSKKQYEPTPEDEQITHSK